jgi:aminoglycoside phosphotransferase
VILDIADLVARHCRVPEPTARGLRVAFLKTTEPTFLVFARHQPFPLFVAKVAAASTLERRLALSSRLYELLPDAIAKPFGVFPLGDGRALLVQNGLPGVPWFRLADQVRTADDWEGLARRCRTQLAVFHAAVATEPAWVVQGARFDEALRGMTAALADLLVPLGPGAATALAEAAEVLAAMAPVTAVWQHGDFVLNNLLVDERRLGVLDLDDFGRWRAPFVDAFALACSIHLHARTHVPWHHLSSDLAACAAAEPGAAAYTARQKTAFFAYFLLAAITDTLQRPTRATIRLTYLEYLRDLVDDGPRYLRAFEQPATPGGA